MMKPLDGEVKQALLAPFQSAEVRVRTHPYVAAYVTARVVMTRLDEALPWQWEFHLKGQPYLDAKNVLHQDGFLRIFAPDGSHRDYHDRGDSKPDDPKSIKADKTAVSDCFKRCAVHVGVGRYLYELTGVSALKIAKPGLEKALAAVGYSGPWDERHYGAIGGVREADDEDDYRSEAPPAPPANETRMPAESPNEPKPANRDTAPKGDKEAITMRQRSRIVKAWTSGGGKVNSPAFKARLRESASNQAESLEALLPEEADKVAEIFERMARLKKVTDCEKSLAEKRGLTPKGVRANVNKFDPEHKFDTEKIEEADDKKIAYYGRWLTEQLSA